MKTTRNGTIEPSPVSSITSSAYKILSKTTREIFDNALVLPGLMVANTDTRYYWDIAKDIYRFCPTINQPTDFERFHGINERISIANYAKIINFYFQLIKNYDRV